VGYSNYVEIVMPVKEQVIQIAPDILGDKPVFAGTRVPVQTLFDYLENNHNLSEFPNDFPTVKCKQVKQVLISRIGCGKCFSSMIK
jgi:uncharacterized protein (DUF433 family)